MRLRHHSLVLMICLLLSACFDESLPTSPGRPVLYIEVGAEAVGVTERFTGVVQPRHQLVAAFCQGGRLASRQVEVGQQVRKGDLLASLELSDQQNDVRSSQWNVSRTEVLWRNARDEAARYQGLHAQGVGSLARLEQLSSEVRVRAAALQQARIELRQARERLQQARIEADLEGVVTAWHAEVGQVLAAGTPVVSLARLDSLEIWVDLPAEWLTQAQKDAGVPRIRVTSMLDAAQSTWAEIRQVDPMLDVATRMRRVRLSAAQLPERFRLGSMVVVELVSEPQVNEPSVPASALWRDKGQDFVWLIEAQSARVRAQRVEVLERSADWVRLRGGLQPGDRVVSAGVHALQEGQWVALDKRGS